MARFSLTPYTLRIRDTVSGTYLPLGNLSEHQDLLQLFTEYLHDRMANYSFSPTSQKLLRVVQYSSQARVVSGVVETGEYGFEADLYNIQTSSVSYQRTVDDAEMMPFYFMANLPRQQDEGILILQRTSQYGIRTVFLQDLAKHIKEIDATKHIEINPLVPADLLSQYLKDGRLTKVRLIRFMLPSDMAVAYDSGGHREEFGYVEYSINARRNQTLPFVGRMLDVIAHNREINQMTELQGYDYDTVKVELELGGSRRTLDLSNINKLRAHYDISDDVDVGANGHPIFASIDKAAHDLMDTLMSTIGTPSQ